MGVGQPLISGWSHRRPVCQSSHASHAMDLGLLAVRQREPSKMITVASPLLMTAGSTNVTWSLVALDLAAR